MIVIFWFLIKIFNANACEFMNHSKVPQFSRQGKRCLSLLYIIYWCSRSFVSLEIIILNNRTSKLNKLNGISIRIVTSAVTTELKEVFKEILIPNQFGFKFVTHYCASFYIFCREDVWASIKTIKSRLFNIIMYPLHK